MRQFPSQSTDPSSQTQTPWTDTDVNRSIAQNIGQLAPITQMQVSFQPGVIVVTFQAYGFGSTVRLGLGVEGTPGKQVLVAQNVAVEGLISWVETAKELTSHLQDALAQVTKKWDRPLLFVSVLKGEIQLLFAPV